MRRAANAHEQPVSGDAALFAAAAVGERNLVEHLITAQGDHVGVRDHFDVFGGIDAVDQILGQGALQRIAADHDVNALRVIGEMHGGLPGRIAAADDVDLLALNEGRLASAGAVIHTGAEQTVFVGEAEPAVFDAGRADSSMGDDAGAVFEVDDAFAGLEFGAHPLARQQNLHSELAGLFPRPFGEFGAADAGGEAQVVFDIGAAAGLTADRPALHQHRAQTVGAAVHLGAQPGRTRAVDRKIVFGARRRDEPAEFFDDLADGRTLHAHAVREYAHRQAAVAEMLHAGLRARRVVVRELHPVEGNVAALQNVADRMALDGAERAVDFHQ